MSSLAQIDQLCYKHYEKLNWKFKMKLKKKNRNWAFIIFALKTAHILGKKMFVLIQKNTHQDMFTEKCCKTRLKKLITVYYIQ